jgi:hypothetical protein
MEKKVQMTDEAVFQDTSEKKMQSRKRTQSAVQN